MAHCASDVSFIAQSSILFFVDSKRLSYLILKSRRCCIPLNGPFKPLLTETFYGHTQILLTYFISKSSNKVFLILCSIPGWLITGQPQVLAENIKFM